MFSVASKYPVLLFATLWGCNLLMTKNWLQNAYNIFMETAGWQILLFLILALMIALYSYYLGSLR